VQALRKSPLCGLVNVMMMMMMAVVPMVTMMMGGEGACG
jgi:hypothetical protein